MRRDVFEGSDLIFEPIRLLSHSLSDDESLDPLIERIGAARCVLLGEASHGTSEYYSWRARITRRLIVEEGFDFVAVEGDWPECYEVNRYLKGYSDAAKTALDALVHFRRWPTWMWGNWEVVALLEWLKRLNDSRSEAARVGFYGLDVYSLWESLEQVLDHVLEAHPDAVEAAVDAFDCFEPFNRDAKEYAWSTSIAPEDCHDEVVDLLRRLRLEATHHDDPEAHFNAEQNGYVAVNAEAYYRSMVRGGSTAWNLRDTHMADTLDRLMEHHGPNSKCVVWEHNTHIGDARATDMEGAGMVNLGQLARQRHGESHVVLVGFGSYVGTVIAGRRWGAPGETMPLPPGREDSWEDVLHRSNPTDRLLILEDFKAIDGLMGVLDHRAVGVVYSPERERWGNYVPSIMPQRYDAFLYLDETHALHPLAPAGRHDEGREADSDPPDTYPFGV
jgi:erythromycin esterase